MTALLLDDAWIEAHSLLEPKATHAIGCIALTWGICEYWSDAICASAVGLGEATWRAVSSELSFPSKWSKAVEVAKSKRMPHHLVDELVYARTAFDTVRINRNAIIHASYAWSSKSKLRLRKSRDLFASRAVLDDVASLRRVVEDISSLRDYLQSLAIHLATLREGEPYPIKLRPKIAKSVIEPL